MPEGIFIVIGLLVLAVLVAIILPLAQKAAVDPFVDASPERTAYLERGGARYNKFSDTNDVTKGNFLRANNEFSIRDGDKEIAAASRTSELVADPAAQTKLGISPHTPVFRLPPPNAILADAKRCEAAKGRGACSKLGTDALKGCGVCIKGGTSYQDPDNVGKHIGGLVLLEEDRLSAEEEAKSTGKTAKYIPSVGECPEGYFFVDRAACEKEVRRLNCKEVGISGGFNGGRTEEGQILGEAECAAVPNAGANVYIYDPKNRTFTVNLRVIAPVRTGTTTVQVLDNAGRALANGSAEEGGKEFVVTIKNIVEGAPLKLRIDESKPYIPFMGAPEYYAVLLQWESADGKRIGKVEPSIVSVNGQGRDSENNIKVLRKYGTFARSNIVLLPRPSTTTRIQTDTQWIWAAGNSGTLNLDVVVPGTFLDPAYTEDLAVAPTGPLITKKSTLELLRASPCMKPDQKPGKYSLACLKTLFMAAGGNPNRGSIARNGLEQLNRIGDGSAETISAYLDGLFALATRGKTAEGMKASMTEINDAAVKLFGFEIVSPCEDIFEDERGEIGLAPKVGGVDTDCLDYLWTNTGNDRSRGDEDRSRNTTIKNTYVSIFDRYSGLRTSEGTAAEVAAAPFATCVRDGTLAPKDRTGKVNIAAVQTASAKGGIQAIQDFYNSVYKAANYKGGSSATKGEHETALLQCYGIKRSGSAVTETIKCPTPALLSIGSRVSFSPVSNSSLYARHAGFVMWTHSNNGSEIFRKDGTFKVVAPLAGTPGAISLESVNSPGYFVVPMNFRVQIFPGTNLRRRNDGEWYVRPAVNNVAGQVSLESVGFGSGWFMGRMGDQVRLIRSSVGNAAASWIVQAPLIA